jgi:phage terminase large subunit
MTAEVRADHPEWRWGNVFMPHDAAHRDPKYGKSHKEVMREQGWDVEDIPQIGVANYLEQGRQLFKKVYVSDSEECRDLIHCLKRFKYMITADGRKTTGVEKDEYSHGGEAWCYAAVVAEQMTNSINSIPDPYANAGIYAG